ncbi:hypothetical protein Tco_0316212 [Tanacetum coccineum]
MKNTYVDSARLIIAYSEEHCEFWIELTPGATPVAKSPYRLAPSELEELSGKLKELQDKDLKGDKLCNAPVLALPDRPEDFVNESILPHDLELGCGLVFALKLSTETLSVWEKRLRRNEVKAYREIRAKNMILSVPVSKDRYTGGSEGGAVDEVLPLLQKGFGSLMQEAIMDLDFLEDMIHSVLHPVTLEEDRDVHLFFVESVIRQLCGIRLEKKSYADKRRKPLEFSVDPVEILEERFRSLKSVAMFATVQGFWWIRNSGPESRSGWYAYPGIVYDSSPNFSAPAVGPFRCLIDIYLILIALAASDVTQEF